MSQLQPSKIASKTTHKIPTASIAVFCSENGSPSHQHNAQLLGKEIARQGHVICLSEINQAAQSVISGAKLHHGMIIGYVQSEDVYPLWPVDQLSHVVISNTDFDHCQSMMLRSVSAVIIINDKADILRPFAQLLPSHVILGVLTSTDDTSQNLLDLLTVSGVEADAVVLDSSPINLAKRILKHLRYQQLRHHRA